MPNDTLRLLARLGRQHGWHDADDFYGRLGARLSASEALAEPGLQRIVNGLRTRFFSVNLVTRKEFVKLVFPDLSVMVVPSDRGTVEIDDKRVILEEIDSFRDVRGVSPQAVAHLVPVSLTEDEVQRCIERILGEATREKDWGGERSDIFTRQVIIKGKRGRAAFVLKGSGKKGTLFPANLGKRGDQIQRAFGEPADIVIVQHIGRIDSTVDKEAEAFAGATGILYCIIDGTDTARLLTAYRCICPRCGNFDLEQCRHACAQGG